MFLTEFLQALGEAMPKPPEDLDEEVYCPHVSCETQSRQYSITGVRQSEDGDLVIQMDFVT